MGELQVNVNLTLDGVTQANGGPTEQDGDFEHAGWSARSETRNPAVCRSLAR